MEEYVLLQENQIIRYAYMIPDWLLPDLGEEGRQQFWGMEENGISYGIAVLREEEEAVTLQYLYLAEEYRKAGRGQRFFTHLLLDAYHGKKHAFQIHYIPGEHPEMERLLCSYPFIQEEEKIGSFTCTLEQLMENKYIKGSYSSSIRALSQCTEEGLRSLYQFMIERGEDLVEMPVRKEEYAADCSAVVVEKGKPAGLLLVKEVKGELFIPLLVNFSSNVTAPMEMIRFAVQEGSKKYPKDTVCRFAVISESLLQFLEKLGFTFGKKRRVCTLELSYFALYERDAESYLDDEYYNL